MWVLIYLFTLQTFSGKELKSAGVVSYDAALGLGVLDDQQLYLPLLPYHTTRESAMLHDMCL